MIGEEPTFGSPPKKPKPTPANSKRESTETIQFQLLGFPSRAGDFLPDDNVSTMNYLDYFFLNGENDFAELSPATGYGPIQGFTSKGPINQPITTHQTVQMDEMARILFDGAKPVVPIDGEEAVKDLKICDAIYSSARTGKKIQL